MYMLEELILMKGKFLGDTKGNRDLDPNCSDAKMGGPGESHKAVSNSQFCGPTKGNSDLPPNRTAGHKQGAGDPQGAGGGMDY